MHDRGSIKKEKERAMWYFIVSISSGAQDQQGVPILSVKFKERKPLLHVFVSSKLAPPPVDN